MSLLTSKQCRTLLVAAMGIAVPLSLKAQFTSSLAPSLTADPETAPVTTLSIDLLTPPRPSIFDATGANVFAGDADPTVNAFSLSTAAGQTDTGLRDATQSGQLNRYSPATARQGLSLSGGAGAGSPGSGSSADQGPESQTVSSNQVGWGTSASFGSETTGSSWSTRALRTQRMGVSQPRSTDGNGSRDMAGTGASDLSSPMSDARTSSSASAAREESGRSSSSSRREIIAAQGGDTGSASEASLLSPLSPREYPFGASPFSAPGGNGEMTFLTPNILSARAPGGSSSQRGGDQRQSRIGQNSNNSETLQTSATRYGLASPLGSTKMKHSSTGKDKSRKNPYLDSSGTGSGNP